MKVLFAPNVRKRVLLDFSCDENLSETGVFMECIQLNVYCEMLSSEVKRMGMDSVIYSLYDINYNINLSSSFACYNHALLIFDNVYQQNIYSSKSYANKFIDNYKLIFVVCTSLFDILTDTTQ
eukprot:123743_1